MRSKLNTTLVLAALGLFTIATACGDDNGTGSPGNGEAGESSSGSGGDGATSAGGSAASGNGGTSNGGDPAVNGGNGGDPAVNGGSFSGNGGSSSGNGGDPSANAGESGGGGMPTGLGGEAGGGGAAAGAGGEGPVTCTPVAPGAFALADIDEAYANYEAPFTPNIGAAAADTFVLSIQGPPDYDGDATGTFDLTENGDDNYKTCARCILAVEDPGPGRTLYYASEGTLVIDAASTQLTGNIDATVTNLKLIEVTIDEEDFTSTPVPNGKCLTVASADIVVTTMDAPAGWTCDPDYYDDDGCDCGCGVKDVDCTGTTDADECEYCTECSGDIEPCGDDEVDPADTTMCL